MRPLPFICEPWICPITYIEILHFAERKRPDYSADAFMITWIQNGLNYNDNDASYYKSHLNAFKIPSVQY